jgi:hypothetical protein
LRSPTPWVFVVGDERPAVTEPAPYDHYRPSDGEDGVYRVVGTGEPVVLLRVTDADGRRRNTGELRRVSREELAAFERVENPDSGFRPMQVVDGMVEEVRMLVDRLR